MKTLLVPALAVLSLAACGRQPAEAPTDGDSVRERAEEAQTARKRTGAEVRERAEEAQTARKRTGAEVQDRALNRVVRAVYICNDSQTLTVDFDNPRQMATVRNSNGQTVDLFQERAADGIWYRASGYELRGKGALATWSADGAQPTTCRAVD